jgi:hypothetical protein
MKSNNLSEVLDKACSVAAFEKNIRKEYYAGKTAKGTQHFAIAINTLKRACGVDPKDQETDPAKIVAKGGKTEGNVSFGAGVKPRNPFRFPSFDRCCSDEPIHRKAKSGKEQPFLNPEDFTVTASGAVRDKILKSKKRKSKKYSSLVAWLESEK